MNNYVMEYRVQTTGEIYKPQFWQLKAINEKVARAKCKRKCKVNGWLFYSIDLCK